ncbi:MAG TPA: DUF4234 domain-containing protein [Cellvibrio sp.]|nr:DUF4234 domain-containing protein [Cellvibrio sp.]
MTTENIYSAPQSDVTAVLDTSNEIEIFPRISAWMVFFLMIPTLGLYYYYWLYSRTKLVNSLPNRSLSTTIPTIMFSLAILSLPISILQNVNKELVILAVVSGIISLVNLVFILITLFSFRGALQHILQSSGASDSNLSGIKTFFFGAIFLQYRINKAIDEKK